MIAARDKGWNFEALGELKESSDDEYVIEVPGDDSVDVEILESIGISEEQFDRIMEDLERGAKERMEKEKGEEND
jgi:ABC-type ATPase with predicted acetyltransferase domain